jgi:hypothetical protein
VLRTLSLGQNFLFRTCYTQTRAQNFHFEMLRTRFFSPLLCESAVPPQLNWLLFTCYFPQVDVSSIPTIRVVQDEGDDIYWSLDNRRLWAFKAAGLKSIPVSIVSPNSHYYRYFSFAFFSPPIFIYFEFTRQKI